MLSLSILLDLLSFIFNNDTDIALGALMDMLSEDSLSYQDTGEVMNCTMSIARHLRGRRLLPFLTRVIYSMIILVNNTNRPAVVNLSFGYLGQLLAVCRSYIQPSVLPMLLKVVSDHMYTASLAIPMAARNIEGTLLEKLLTIVEYATECSVAYEKRFRYHHQRKNGDDGDDDDDSNLVGSESEVEMNNKHNLGGVKKKKNSSSTKAATIADAENVDLLSDREKNVMRQYTMTISDVLPILFDVLVHDRERGRRPATISVCRVLQSMCQRRAFIGGSLQTFIPALSRVLSMMGAVNDSKSGGSSSNSSSGGGSSGAGGNNSYTDLDPQNMNLPSNEEKHKKKKKSATINWSFIVTAAVETFEIMVEDCSNEWSYLYPEDREEDAALLQAHASGIVLPLVRLIQSVHRNGKHLHPSSTETTKSNDTNDSNNRNRSSSSSLSNSNRGSNSSKSSSSNSNASTLTEEEKRTTIDVAVSALCSLARSLRTGFAIYIHTIQKVLDATRIRGPMRTNYNRLIRAILHLPKDDTETLLPPPPLLSMKKAWRRRERFHHGGVTGSSGMTNGVHIRNYRQGSSHSNNNSIASSTTTANLNNRHHRNST